MILWNPARMSLNRCSDIRTSKVPEITLAFWIIKIAAKRLRMITRARFAITMQRYRSTRTQTELFGSNVR